MPSGLPDIFATTPSAPVPAHSIAEFPAGTFLESIAVAPDNTLLITSHLDGKIWRIGRNGQPVLHSQIAGKATGLAFLSYGDLMLSGWDAQDVSCLFQIKPDGSSSLVATLPDALFLNGLTLLDAKHLLIADSYRGAIWVYSLAEATVNLWLEHPELARSISDSSFPAVNGLKFYNGVLYASNTEKMQLVKIPVVEGQPGQPEVFVAPINLDDFAFDHQGNLYGTTHVYNSVVKIAPNGTVTTIAGPEAGMTGSTALAFGRSSADQTSLYVVTNGGLSLSPSTGLEPARVVRLEVGIAGLPLLG
jgi:sugar lactone lactonase YvrE